VDNYRLTTVDLQSVSYKDDEWVLTNRVAQVAYYAKPKESNKESNQHVVVSGKQRIVGVNGVQSPEEYNNYAEFSLVTDHPCKIKIIVNRVSNTKMKPWFCPDGEKKSIIGSLPAK
jgi:hypothetical protein